MKMTVKVKWDQFRLQEIHIPRGQEAETCVCDICSARRTKGIGRKGYNSTVIEKVKIEPSGDQQIKIEKI